MSVIIDRRRVAAVMDRNGVGERENRTVPALSPRHRDPVTADEGSSCPPARLVSRLVFVDGGKDVRVILDSWVAAAMRVLQKTTDVTAQCVRATCHGKALAYQHPPQCPTIPILSHAFVFQVFHVVLVFVARQPLWLVSAGKPFLIAGPVARGSGENIGIRIAEHVVAGRGVGRGRGKESDPQGGSCGIGGTSV